MAEIRFKATRRKHDSGYRALVKRGDMQFDADPNSSDGIWLYVKNAGRIHIDCDYKTGEFRIVFNGEQFVVQE